jgi:hypothetical protein
MQASDHWPTPSAHREYWEHRHNAYIYEYDPTDDGQEWFTLRIILATHDPEELEVERQETMERRCGRIKSRYYV